MQRHSCMPSSLAPDPVRVKSCLWKSYGMENKVELEIFLCLGSVEELWNAGYS